MLKHEYTLCTQILVVGSYLNRQCLLKMYVYVCVYVCV